MATSVRSAGPAKFLLLTFFAVSLAQASRAQSATLGKVTQPDSRAQPITVHAIGRTQLAADAMYTYQWPGVYFTVDYEGSAFFFRSGPGKQHLRLLVDGKPSDALLDAAPATYRIATQSPGKHHVRIDVINENQDSSKSLGAFAVEVAKARPQLSATAFNTSLRQIEFIGDSHTVGYGNTSSTHDCTPDQVWSTTDTTLSPGARTAAHFHADYQLLAISGRGVVRNWNGITSPLVPEAYPFTLLKSGDNNAQRQRFGDPTWKPSVIVISLGTNDFSTDLNAVEPWKTRDDLHTAFETAYVAFVRSLRAAHPHALILLWSTDMVHGEIATEGRKVADTLRSRGDKRVDFIKVPNLTFSGCNGHPTVADDQTIADKLSAAIDAAKVAW